MKAVKNKRAVTVGIFIFLGLVILVVTVFTLGGQKRTFARAVPLKTVFEDVGGLQVGNNVWLAGVKIGTVKQLRFVPNTGVEVTMNIDDRVAPLIHKDSKTKISSNGLMGNKIVVIFGGSKAAPPIQRDDLLLSEKPINTEDMLAVLQQNNKNLLDITGNFKNITQRLSEGQGTLGELLNNEKMAASMRASILALQAAISNFRSTAARSNEAVSSLVDFTAQLNKQGTLMNDLVTDTTVFSQLRNTVARLQEVADTASKATADIKNATGKLTEKTNTAGALLNDEDLAAHLKSAVSNLDSASKNLNEDLIALQHNFLLKGYFKKKTKK